ncbi:efflux RND transporter periplasmic adaptor subunit [Shewanella yunxiaonensis]|uniref:Efflux RND transporter periplasmic adaptor subunit n=1 Tax=Shewanella yunxiaonensis TaxID=2829809 RepID=A0ABX7YR11_9GAMM|nr:efflux RND transporter periplasmic adaptor subunit [Shewanella yunxiaonensis]QUN05203.1 efflux RND transporter periplasmic adaptor subunit [Shewanella yunxiaonensis]
MNIFLRRVLPPVIIVVVAVLVVGVLLATKKTPPQKPEEKPIPVVDVQTVKPQTMSLSLASYGTVNPKYKTQLVSEVKGRIVTIAPSFVAGGMVRAGDELAVIEPFDYQADLRQAEATLAQNKAALDEEIARGKVAKVDFADFKGVPPDLGLRVPQLKESQANVKYAQAAVDRAKRNLERTVIRAPFDGLVRSRNVDLGQYVSVGTELGELYDTAIAEVRLPLANKDLAYLESIDHPFTEVTLSTQLGGKNINWRATIVRSEGVIDPDNRMVYLVAEVKDPYLRQYRAPGQLPLKFGSFVDAAIQGRTVEDVVKLPSYLVRNNLVAVIGPDNKVEMRKVTVVRTDLDSVYIKDGLKDGERVSLTTLNNMSTGQLVKVAGDENKGSSHQPQDAEDAQRLAKAGER